MIAFRSNEVEAQFDFIIHSAYLSERLVDWTWSPSAALVTKIYS